jgi:hypothetical protein
MRATALIAGVCLLSAATTGCGKKGWDKASPSGKRTELTTETRPETRAETKAETRPEGKTGAREAAPPPAVRPAVAAAVVGVERRPLAAPKDNGLPSGILTAGSFDDNVDPFVFRSFVNKLAQNGALGGLADKLRGHPITVIVKDSAGKPVGNARVKLSANGAASAELTTRSDGRAVFLPPWDNLPASESLSATVTAPTAKNSVTEVIAAGASRWEITVPGIEARRVRNLDLAIVLDTTGSMGDELDYLKAEFRGISAAIHKKFPDLQQRFALVLYRDDGDEYVVRPFDFTNSLGEFHTRLAAQRASGGGDYPEAVHRGLEEANQLRWRDEDTARVLFLVGDAPPHAQFRGRTMAAADALRKKGVAIYPIACSGYDDACELVMRSCAMLTGSQFLFLTDDSGVGGAHAEPRIPYYQVERLERLMIRMIAGELSGQRVEPAASDIIRTVGKRVN